MIFVTIPKENTLFANFMVSFLQTLNEKGKNYRRSKFMAEKTKKNEKHINHIIFRKIITYKIKNIKLRIYDHHAKVWSL